MVEVFGHLQRILIAADGGRQFHHFRRQSRRACVRARAAFPLWFSFSPTYSCSSTAAHARIAYGRLEKKAGSIQVIMQFFRGHKRPDARLVPFTRAPLAQDLITLNVAAGMRENVLLNSDRFIHFCFGVYINADNKLDGCLLSGGQRSIALVPVRSSAL